MKKTYRLIATDGSVYESDRPGEFGGYSPKMIYGRLDCRSAIRHLPGYAKSRVFFADELTAIAAGYRPCGKCMREAYAIWKRGGNPGTLAYPSLKLPQNKESK